MGTFNVTIVTNSILSKVFENKKTNISHLKLRKLSYCLHGWHLAIYDKPLIDSGFNVWQYEPVNEQLYHVFKQFDNNQMAAYAETQEAC